jgi:hypothetical protein
MAKSFFFSDLVQNKGAGQAFPAGRVARVLEKARSGVKVIPPRRRRR